MGGACQRKMGGREIFEFRNVLDVANSAYAVNGAYIATRNPTEAPKHNAAVAIIRELLRGNTADVRQSAREASTAISIVQTFVDAAATIGNKLTAMEELAKKASSPDYSRVEVEDMQKELENLAKEINTIVKGTRINSTEYDYNKLFTADGKAVSLSIGDGSKIDIFARDLSFDVTGLSLTGDPAGALSKVREAIRNVNDYNRYFNKEVARLEDATATIERRTENAMGIDLSELDVDVAKQLARNMKGENLEDVSALAYVQANVMPERALQLLKNKG